MILSHSFHSDNAKISSECWMSSVVSLKSRCLLISHSCFQGCLMSAHPFFWSVAENDLSLASVHFVAQWSAEVQWKYAFNKSVQITDWNSFFFSHVWKWQCCYCISCYEFGSAEYSFPDAAARIGTPSVMSVCHFICSPSIHLLYPCLLLSVADRESVCL